MATYASSAGDPSGFYDIAGLSKWVNAFFVMAYDVNQGPAQGNGNAAGADASYISQYISAAGASKVILGLAALRLRRTDERSRPGRRRHRSIASGDLRPGHGLGPHLLGRGDADRVDVVPDGRAVAPGLLRQRQHDRRQGPAGRRLASPRRRRVGPGDGRRRRLGAVRPRRRDVAAAHATGRAGHRSASTQGPGFQGSGNSGAPPTTTTPSGHKHKAGATGTTTTTTTTLPKRIDDDHQCEPTTTTTTARHERSPPRPAHRRTGTSSATRPPRRGQFRPPPEPVPRSELPAGPPTQCGVERARGDMATSCSARAARSRRSWR